MKAVSVTTLIAFVAVVASVTVLTALHQEVPAALTSILGSLGVAVLPALVRRSIDEEIREESRKTKPDDEEAKP